MKSFAYAALLALLPSVMAAPATEKKARFTMTAVDVLPMDGQKVNATMVKELEYQPVQAFAGYFWIGHAQKAACTVASRCYGVYNDTVYDFYQKDYSTVSLVRRSPRSQASSHG